MFSTFVVQLNYGGHCVRNWLLNEVCLWQPIGKRQLYAYLLSEMVNGWEPLWHVFITTIAQKPPSPSEWASRLLVCTCTYTHAHSLGTSEGDVQTILHHCANDHSKSALACVSVERARAKVRDKAGEVPQIGSFVTANWDFLWVSYAVSMSAHSMSAHSMIRETPETTLCLVTLTPPTQFVYLDKNIKVLIVSQGTFLMQQKAV